MLLHLRRVGALFRRSAPRPEGGWETLDPFAVSPARRAARKTLQDHEAPRADRTLARSGRKPAPLCTRQAQDSIQTGTRTGVGGACPRQVQASLTLTTSSP